MAVIPPAALVWLSKHHGIADVSALKARGVTRGMRRWLIDEGMLIHEHRGVYRIASQPVTLESRCAALSLFQTEGFVTGPTGGRLHGLRRMPRAMTEPPQGSGIKPIEIITYAVPHGGWLDLDGVKMRQTTSTPDTDVQVRADGIRLAAPWRLAFDLAADLPSEDLASVVEQMIHKKLCTFVTLAATAKRLAAPARPGSKQFVEVLAGRMSGGPLESHPEVRVGKALLARGLPLVAQQTWLDLPNGRKIRLDFSVPEIRWGLEVDVHPDHFLRQGTADRQRDRQCHQIGWQVDRVTAVELLDLDATCDDLVVTYQRRAEEMGGRSI